MFRAIIIVWMTSVFAALFSVVPCGAQQTIASPSFTARVDNGGMLSSLKMHGSELLRAPFVFGDGVKWSVSGVDSAGGDTRVSLKAEHGSGEIRYHADGRQLVIRVTQKLGGFANWSIPFGDDVLAIENLQNDSPGGAEAIQYKEHGEIRALPLTHMGRVQRARLYLRTGGTVLFWHDGWGAPFNLDEMGGISGSVYRRGILENDHPMKIVFEAETPASPPLRPAPPFTVTANAFAGLFHAGASPSFTVRFEDSTLARLSAAPRWRLSWTVRDFDDIEVGSGAQDFDSTVATHAVSVATPVRARGWLTVLFSIAPLARIDPMPAPSEFRTRFAVIGVDSSLPAVPPVTAKLDDYGYMGLVGVRGMRESHTMRDFYPERGKINEKALDELFDHASEDARRWGESWFFQANERPAWCSDADYEQVAFDLVSRARGRCHVWEVENEPNFRYSPADYVSKALIPFARGAKRADPTCRILAPACVSVPNTIRFVDAIIAADALKLVGGISTHTYMGPGEPWELFGNPQYLAELRRKIGNLPLWQTEQGYTWNHSSRREQARYVVRQYLNAAASGIPSERQYYFYPVHNGFEPWYLVESGSTDGLNGTYEPAGIALRVLSEQTDGLQAGAREEPLPGTYMLRYSGADHDVIAIWTLDYALPLTLSGRIEGAADFMGNPLSLQPRGNREELTVDGFAKYLRVRHGAPLTVVAPVFGRNYAQGQQASIQASIQASSETKDHPAALAMDGRWAMRDPVPSLETRTYWEAAEMGASEQKPCWLRVDFAAPRTIDRSLLITPLPAVDGGVPRDYRIQVSSDGAAWTDVASAHDWVGWAGMLFFKPVKTSHVRVLITKLNDGWHLDGRWEFMVSDTFTRYTSMQCRVLDLMLFGP